MEYLFDIKDYLYYTLDDDGYLSYWSNTNDPNLHCHMIEWDRSLSCGQLCACKIVDGVLMLDAERWANIEAERASEAIKASEVRIATTLIDKLTAEVRVTQAIRIATDEQIVELRSVLPKWTWGKHSKNDAVIHDGQPWRCVQDIDSTHNSAWYPGAVGMAAHWALLHAKSKAYAMPFIIESQNPYMSGEWMIWEDGLAYECLVDVVVHSPADRPEAWRQG